MACATNAVFKYMYFDQDSLMSLMIGISRATLGSAHSVRTGGEADVALIIIYLCMDNTAYYLLTGGAVKIKSDPLWF